MGKIKDLTGQKYGQLTVISLDEPFITKSNKKQTAWLCKCSCNKLKRIRASDLKSGRVNSCGCLRSDLITKKNTKHNMCNSKEYQAWCNAKDRCYNPNNKYYENYGKRNITMCSKWLHNFEEFLKDVGKSPSKSHSIDRIDNNGNYEPGNIRWATKSVQSRNQRIRKDNTSGYKGISFIKHIEKWQAYINKNNKRINLGYYSDINDAVKARETYILKNK